MIELGNDEKYIQRNYVFALSFFQKNDFVLSKTFCD